jgi:hypothetical protein
LAASRDDEDKFEGKLTPSVGKLAFDVDFYGRGKFPPGVYHSEGHQDGMGLCLYLAMMNHTLGADFTLAVLDDVLMCVAHSRRPRRDDATPHGTNSARAPFVDIPAASKVTDLHRSTGLAIVGLLPARRCRARSSC